MRWIARDGRRHSTHRMVQEAYDHADADSDNDKVETDPIKLLERNNPPIFIPSYYPPWMHLPEVMPDFIGEEIESWCEFGRD